MDPNRTNSWELFIFNRWVLTWSGPSLGRVWKLGWCPQLCALVATLLFAPLPEGRSACRARGHRAQFRLQESSDRKWAAHIKTGLGPKHMQLSASAAQASLGRKPLQAAHWVPEHSWSLGAFIMQPYCSKHRCLCRLCRLYGKLARSNLHDLLVLPLKSVVARLSVLRENENTRAGCSSSQFSTVQSNLSMTIRIQMQPSHLLRCFPHLWCCATRLCEAAQASGLVLVLHTKPGG